MKNYHHLSAEERAVIWLERDRGLGLRQIAARLDRSPSSISRELRRNAQAADYCPTQAGKAYTERRTRCVKHCKLAANPELLTLVERLLVEVKWSPEQIARNLEKRFAGQPSMQISHETIYAHIYAYPKNHLRKVLVGSLRQGKSKRGPRGSKDSYYSSLKVAPHQEISQRPEEINTREIPGHWEGDLIIGALNKSCVGTLVERKTGYVILNKMQSKSAQHVREGFEANMIHVPAFLRRSLTYDRGSELAQHALMSERLNIDIYFADCRAPWQRGSSENINGLLRQFLPKGEDLSRYSQADLDHIAFLLNTRPRKRFDFDTPMERFDQEIIQYENCCT